MEYIKGHDEIIHIRIDERLIHGQVAVYWTRTLGADRIMVIDDEVAKNKMQVSLLKMAVPAGVKLSILPTKSAAENIMDGKYKGQKVFIVVNSPTTLIQLVEHGLPVVGSNVGNLTSTSSSVKIMRTVVIDADQTNEFIKASEKGVFFTAQMAPTDPIENDFMNVLKLKINELQ